MLAADYHISVGTAGLSVTVFSVVYMLSAPLLGRLSDRVGRRRILLGALWVFAAANLLTALAVDLPSLLAIRLVAGAAAAGISPSIYALVGDAALPDRRATRLALVISGLLVSIPLGAAAAAPIAAFVGWPAMFLGLAGFSLVLLCFNARVWPSARGTSHGASASPPDPIAVSGLAPRLMPTVIWSTGLYGVYTYLGTGLVSLGFSAAQTAEAIFFYGCGAIAGVFAGGRSADRVGIKFTAAVSLAGLCACLLLLRMALDTGTLVAPAIGLTSAVAQLFFPAQQAGLAKDFPHRCATALAWNNSALFLGISLGSLLGAKALALGSFDANLTISAGIALIGCLIVAAVVPSQVRLGGKGARDARQVQIASDGRGRLSDAGLTSN
jgi:predicted MFS family arabinose efflux permease